MRVLAFIRQRSFARYVAFDMAEAARRMGWSVDWLDLDGERQHIHGLPDEARAEACEALRRRVSALGPDLVFSYGLEAFADVCGDLAPASRWSVADVAGVPIACFLFDFGYPFDGATTAGAANLIARLRAPDVGLWCWDEAATADLARHGLPAAWFPMAVNDHMFTPPASGAARDLPVVFSGGPTPERLAALERLAPCGVSIYGYGDDAWRASDVLRDAHRGVVVERTALRDVYRRARVAVNVTRPHGRASLNMRVFEAMACGCVVVTDRPDAAARLFTPDVELVTYTSLDELDARVRQLLAHDEHRARIAEAGAVAVATRHTYALRVASIAADLRALMIEGRAWRRYLAFRADDPDKAARFVDTLHAQGLLRRLDVWPAQRGA